ncbi:MAG: integral rane protein [Nocardioidaceae bacterium]|nr:integral rane protein [Nocardioidaceae bacterium]
MDLDAYVGAHHTTWRRLEELSRRSSRSGEEADELVDLYQQVATHLSVVRSSAPDAAIVAYLSGLLGRARIRLAGSNPRSWTDAADFVARRFPATLYRTRRWWLGVMLGSYGVAVVVAWWLLAHPQVESSLIGKAEIDQLVNHDFADYYKQAAASHFAAKVWTNNAWVAALCISLGVFGLPVIYVLWQNVLNLAVVGSIMIRHDRAGVFFGLILPHGLLELTAVFVAAGVGLRLCWAWLVPTGQTRAQSLAAEGRSAVGVAIGLVGVLLVSGIIEGFVTPSGLPTWARIGIGVVAEVLFLVYVFVPGRRAYRAGITGDLDQALLEDRVALAA